METKRKGIYLSDEEECIDKIGFEKKKTHLAEMLCA